MKPTSPRQSSPNWLHRLIEDATTAPSKDFAQIENIMRDEIFHSTLDWQTREQLTDAARQAFARLNADRELYGASRASGLAMFQQMRASQELSTSPSHEHD